MVKIIKKLVKSRTAWMAVILGVTVLTMVNVFRDKEQELPKIDVEQSDEPENFVKVTETPEQQNTPHTSEIDEQPDTKEDNTDKKADAETGENGSEEITTEMPEDEEPATEPVNEPDDNMEEPADDVLEQTIEGKDGVTEVINESGENQGEEQAEEVASPETVISLLRFAGKASMLWPVQGEILIKYSIDHGVYFKTLNQYRTSDAVVIASEVGTNVYAAAKGVIVDISSDRKLGNTVTTAVGDGYFITYGQVTADGLKVGDILEQGRAFTKIAEPSIYYCEEGANLYMRMYNAEGTVDPLEYIR